jgi:hypothetical protein
VDLLRQREHLPSANRMSITLVVAILIELDEYEKKKETTEHLTNE